MSILEPSNILLEQSLVEIKDALKSFSESQIDFETFMGLLEHAAISFQEREGTRGRLEYLDRHEPPLSSKINRILKTLATDIVLLGRQADLLRAAIIMAFNVTNTEILRERNEALRLKGMLKTALLYNEEIGSGVLVWNESFANEDRIIKNLISPLDLQSEILHLGRSNVSVLSHDMQISIEPGSSGFAGAWFEYTGEKGPDGPKVFGEQDPHDRIIEIRDTDPTTWFEYEAAFLPKDERERVSRKGFRYLNSKGEKINWAKGPLLDETNKAIDKLRLKLLCTLSSLKTASEISLIPHWGIKGKNRPFRIVRVEISPDATNWTRIDPKNVTAARGITLKKVQRTDITAKEPRWVFPSTPIQYVRLTIVQDLTYKSRIVVPLQVNKDGRAIEKTLAPTTDRGKLFRDHPFANTTINRKNLRGEKWAIGISDLSISRQDYHQFGEAVFKPINFPKPVDRVSISALLEIPEAFPVNEDLGNGNWIEFYLSHDQGSTWIRVSPQEEPNIGVPEVIAYNDNTPVGFRDQFTFYVDTETPVTSLMTKVAMYRPEELIGQTPMIRDGFRLKVILKETV